MVVAQVCAAGYGMVAHVALALSRMVKDVGLLAFDMVEDADFAPFRLLENADLSLVHRTRTQPVEDAAALTVVNQCQKYLQR